MVKNKDQVDLSKFRKCIDVINFAYNCFNVKIGEPPEKNIDNKSAKPKLKPKKKEKEPSNEEGFFLKTV